MNRLRLFPSLFIKVTSAAALIAATVAPLAQAATITPLTSGDLGGGLDLTTGQTIVYAVDTFSGAQPVIQGVTFSYATGNGPSSPSDTIYGSDVLRVATEINANPTFPGTNYSPTPTANDDALASTFTTLGAGRQTWQYNNTIGTSYRLTLILGLGTGAPGGDSGYVGDFGFKSGNAGIDLDYTLVLDNIVVLPNQSFAVTFDYVATESTSSFNLIYPATYGDTYSGSANPAGALPLGAWTLAVVPEPSTVTLVILGAVGMLIMFRRRAIA